LTVHLIDCISATTSDSAGVGFSEETDAPPRVNGDVVKISRSGLMKLPHQLNVLY
jgi:hypothetical protein